MTHQGTWRPEDRAGAKYRYLPFDVPAGASAVAVALAYDRDAGVLDLGLVGPDGEFRGWSGGARERFVVTADAATPGYLPGPLTPGTWHVMLGLHRVPPPGVEWSVSAFVATGGVPDVDPAVLPVPGTAQVRPVTRPPRRTLPAPAGMRWYAGDLHAHTVHSDGVLTVAELAAEAAEAGLDFLAVTDHNTVSHFAELDAAGRAYGVTLLPGQEVTTDLGHANAFGAIGWVDFRTPAAAWGPAVAAQGGLLSVNHPLGADCAWKQPLPQRPPLAEVWHSGWWDRTWGAPLAWLLGWDPTVVPVGGSDFHDPGQGHRLGEPTTWVCAPEGAGGPELLAALAAGRVAIGASPDGPVLLPVEGELIAVGADGTLLTDYSGVRRIVRGEVARFSRVGDATPGPCWLEDGRTEVQALSARP